jgi:uncharacterized protein YaeQ
MGFVAGFYGFQVELNNTERGVYEKLRFKLARHPEESLYQLCAKALAYTHSFREGEEFSTGLFAPKEPTLFHKDATGALLLWVNVGCPSYEKIERALRHHRGAEFRVYFCSQQEVTEFCHLLRGSTSNWVKDVQFYALPESLLHALAEVDRSRLTWSVSFIDQCVYLQEHELSLQGEMPQLDIWKLYQQSLAQSAEHV